jgi:hypothetical protein
MAAVAEPVLKMVEAATEAFRLSTGKPTPFATPNTVVLDLRTMHPCDYSPKRSGGLPVIVHAPFAGNNSVIADFHGAGQARVTQKPRDSPTGRRSQPTTFVGGRRRRPARNTACQREHIEKGN